VGGNTESLDAKTVRVVHLSGEPVHALVVRKSLEVVAQLLVNFDLVSVLVHIALLEAHGNVFLTAHNDKEAAQHEEHGNGGAVLIPGPAVVVGGHGHVGVSLVNDGVVEDLLVAHNPVAEDVVGKGSPAHQVEGGLVELGAVHGGLLVPVSNAKLLNKVDVEEGKGANGEHHGQGEAVHEGGVDSVHGGGVLEMHQMDGAGVGVDVLLDSLALGLVGFGAGPEVFATLVQAAENNYHSGLHDEAQVDVDGVDKHGPNESIADVGVPVEVEVGHGATERDPGQHGALSVGIGEQHQDGSIEESGDRDQSHNSSGLLGLSVVSNVLDKDNGDVADNHVDKSDTNGHALVEQVTASLVFIEVVAQVFFTVQEAC